MDVDSEPCMGIETATFWTLVSYHEYWFIHVTYYNVPLSQQVLKDECPVNALRAQNLAGGHFLGHEIRLLLYPSVSEQSLV